MRLAAGAGAAWGAAARRCARLACAESPDGCTPTAEALAETPGRPEPAQIANPLPQNLDFLVQTEGQALFAPKVLSIKPNETGMLEARRPYRSVALSLGPLPLRC